MLTVCPAMLNEPKRTVPRLRSIFTDTVPLPVRFSGEVMVSQSPPVSTDDDQEQEAVVVTVIERVSPRDVAAMSSGETSNEQGGSWVMANERPAIVKVALRSAPVLAATLSVTVPLPLPFPPETVIQDGAPVVDQLQAAVVETVTVTVCADADGLAEPGAIV
jgi:hypothetical protein